MIVDTRYVTFINSFQEELTPLLKRIEKEAKADHVPIIRKEMQGLLKVLLASKRPEKILEVGTAVGFSALFMREYDPVPVSIVTIENYEKRIPAAKQNFRRAGCQDEIRLLEGDAGEFLKKMDGLYDMIFMDAAKGQYISFLDDVQRLLAPGGLLISDNVLQDGDIIESRYAVRRRNRTIHKRMRQYLYELTHRDIFETCILPVGDGVTVSVKRQDDDSQRKREKNR